MRGNMPEGQDMQHAATPAGPPRPSIPVMAALSFVALGAGVVVALVASPAASG